ncbi:MAG: alpha/beta hydrolase [Phocaeicola sp.]
MKNKIKLFFLLCFCCVVSLQAAKVDTLQVHSLSMNREVTVLTITPNKALQGEKCPVIYLLHGYGGDAFTWLGMKKNLPEIADKEGIIFVCPDGENSWYWDSPLCPNSRYETFISSELLSYIDKKLPTIADRRGRAITGLSMGGHGGLWLSFRHTNLFGAAGSTSGGVDIRPFPTSWGMDKLLGKFEESSLAWESHTVINQVDQLHRGELALIIDCGLDDFFLDVNKALHKKLVEKGISHDFILRPGGHNSKYWRNSIDYQILFFKKFFAKEN